MFCFLQSDLIYAVLGFLSAVCIYLLAVDIHLM